MDTIKKLFPFSFKEKKTVGELVVNIIIHALVGLVAGILIGLLSRIPVVGILVALVGGLVDIYITAGIVFSVLNYCKVVK